MTDNNQIRTIIQKLEKVAADIRLQTLTKEALKLITIIITAIMTFFILDVLAHFPYVIRLVLFIGGMNYAFYRFIKGPLANYKKDMTAQEVSLIVEDHFPEFRSRLISTLQFDNSPPTANMSLDLISGMMKQTFSMVKDVSFGKVVDQSWKKSCYKKLAISILVSLVLIISMPQSFVTYLQRLVAPVDYPTATQIINVEVPEYLVAGEDFSIKLKASGVRPALGTVTLTSKVDDLDIDLTKLNDDGDYTAAFRGILENSVLNIALNDYESEEIPLMVIKRPAISQINLQVAPPEYTGLKPFTQKSGNSQVPKGAKVTLSVTPTKELKEISLIGRDRELKTQFHFKDGQWHTSFTPDSSVTYSLIMTDTKGLTSKDIPDYRITVKEDKAPTIRIISPSSTSELSPKSSMKLTAKVRDDFVISTVRILYHIGNGEFGEETPLADYQVHQEFNQLSQQEFMYNELWSNRNKGLKEKQILKIRFQAIDSSPAKNTALSEEIIIPIISEAEMRLRLSEEFVDAILPVEDLKLKLNSSTRQTEKLGEQE